MSYDSDSFIFDSDLENDDTYEYLSDNDDIVVLKRVATKKSLEIQALCLGNQQLQEMQNEIITSVASILGLAFDICRALLRGYYWDRERVLEAVMDSPSKAYKICSIEILLNSSQVKFAIQKTFLCNVCCDDSQNQKTLTLQCGHEFCLDCHKTYYEQSISEGNVKKILCPGSCGTLVQDETLQKVVSPALFSKFLQLQDNYFVDSNKNIKWCPFPDCKYALKYEATASLSSIVPSIFCNSGHSFCFSCDLEEHMPCLCSYAKAWLKKTQDDSETSNWIISNTKECPKCNAPIEKNGGCNRIVCGKCHFEFCWTCLKSWSVHGYDRGCNAFVEVTGEESDQVLESRASLEKYLHYHTRYVNHIQSSQLDQKLYIHTERIMEDLQQNSSFSWIEVQFLKEAFNTLVKCRSILKWTYAFAYYLKSGNQKVLFEDNQQDLEFATEALSGLLEEDFEFEGLPQLKQNIQDKAKYVAHRREILLAFILQGYKDGIWEYTADL